MAMDTENTSPAGEPEDEDVEEITVGVTEDDLVLIEGAGWDLVLSPQEARDLADALRDAAEDAETPADASAA
jgi:hypothetical protein